MAVGVVLLLFLVRPGVSRLKGRIITSISAAVGRPSDIGAVHLRLLPRPGFDLDNLVVYDDPAFGAEPILRASEVTADLRLFSLLRGRLEIAELDLSEPSLNLVHGDNGRWNLEALLERSSHTPLAPTAKMKSERREEFPYIHATAARINFKNGFEKKPYALTNADFSLWQESENTWGLRLKAQPMRTDLNLNDTGVLQVNGTWRRAAAFRETPMDFRLEWSRGQLGQLTKFFTGNDKGWRGGVQIDAAMKGTPAKLEIVSDAAVQDFRRYDITTGDAVTLAGHCEGEYSAEDHEFHQMECKAPVAGGMVRLKGEAGLPGSHQYELEVTAEDVPVNAMAALARRMKKNLPDDLTASGILRASMRIRQDGPDGPLRMAGKGEIQAFQLVSTEDNAESGPETIPIVFGEGAGLHAKRGDAAGLEGALVEIGPFGLGTGRTNGAAVVRAAMSRGGYQVAIVGDADVAKSLRIARMLGIPTLETAAEGTASVDLAVAGWWGAGGANGAHAGFLGPQVTGAVKLRNVRVELRGTAGPVEIASAEMRLLPGALQVAKLNAVAAETTWTGSLEMPRGCGVPEACELHFNLNANHIALSELAEWVRPKAKKRPWYRLLEASAANGPSFFAKLRASGRISADHAQVEKLAVSQAAASVEVDREKLRIKDLTAELLGGKHRGEWAADFRENPTNCEGHGSLAGVSLAKLAVSEAWITGTASGSYELKGPCSVEFWDLAEGTMQFDVSDGTMPRVSLNEDEGPVKIVRMSGAARVDKGKFAIKDAMLNSPGGKFQVTGSVGEGRAIEVKLTRSGAGGGYEISGTLAQPHVTAIAGTEQARLKR